MGYLIYNINSTLIFGGYDNTFRSEAAAKGALTKAVNKNKIADRSEYAIADVSHFYSDIEKKETKKNLMGGKDFEQGVNTPISCDPSSETYWSM